MGRVKKFINRLSIRKKLIFYSYMVMTPIMLIISTTLVVKNYGDTQKSKNLRQMQSVKSLDDSVDVLRKDMQNLCTYLCINEDVLKILNSKNPEELNRNHKLWLDEAPMNFLLDIFALKGYVKTIAIYPENGVNYYLKSQDASAHVAETKAVQSSEMYKEAVEAGGAVLWKVLSKEKNDVYLATRAEKLVLYREIYDLSKKNALAFLVLGANTDVFLEPCKNAVQSEEEGIVILSPNGQELLEYGMHDEKVAEYLTKEMYSYVKQKNAAPSFEYGKYDVFWSQNEKSSFIVCKLVPKVSIGDLLKEAAVTPLILLAAFLMGLCPILIFISHIITQPLNLLTVAMGKFKKGDFTQQIPVSTQDEMGVVAEGFNVMVEDIKKLIDTNYVMALKEKESELNALQAQINPHFLYNTLDALYWRALEFENEEIAEDILALSNLFRMVLGQGKGIITVDLEEELINTYLHIQKMRFGKRLNYSMTIEDEIKEALIPKLILQPFVENAIVHGIENVGTNATLIISGKKVEKNEKTYIEFDIADTGKGMTQEQLEDIWKTNEARRYASQRIGHYAIRNVKERLELKYHEDFSLTIDSELGKGTIVHIVIPFELAGGRELEH